MAMIHDILKKYWGYDAFRPLQEEIIQSVLANQDTLALLPTGGGKSICFQVPALAREGICLVISPLIALMKDQVQQLKRRGISAIAIYSGMSKQEIDIALDNCKFGNVKFLYISPERLKTDLFIARAKQMNIGLLAIDEAHCVSQWGYDFRPPYLEIAQFRELIPNIPCIALTATATPEVRDDIQEKLQFTEGAQVFQKSFSRANLSYSVRYEENKEVRLVGILRKVPGTSVVYVRSRKKTKLIADYLRQNHINADYYHAGLSNEVRTKKQDDWIQNRMRVIISTNAFGMGIDKPDVRLVVHLDLPENLEAYYQEAGRGGRDEKLAYALVLYSKDDLDILQKRVRQSYPAIERIKLTYQSLANYYKIAVGSNLMATYDFDLDAFIKTYDLPYMDTYHALRRLEEQGFIQLNEAYHAPSKVMFIVGKQRLYEFQISNSKLDPLIKLLLRAYGGELFTNFVRISEKQIAQYLKVEERVVQKGLEYLHKSEIIHFEAQKEKPQLTFTTERFSVATLPFDKKSFETRKERDISKMESVIHYVTHHRRCRTQLLLAYFGEDSDEKCGICDFCIEEKKAKKRQDVPDFTTQIVEVLAKESLSVKALTSLLGKEPVAVLDQIRSLVESGEIYYTETGELSLSN